MRSIAEIKNSIVRAFIGNEVLQQAYGFDSNAEFKEIFSKVSLENILIDIVAFSIWILEKLFNQHKKEVDEALLERTPHTLRWYRNKAKDFQYGFNLIAETDKFDNEGHTETEVEGSKIVKYAAVVEADDEKRLIIKIATDSGDELQPITPEQEESFKIYMSRIKDAGVPITVVNYLPDVLRLYIRVFRNPMVLDANGTNILDGSKPVENAINDYLKSLPFNGELILQELLNAIEGTEGVEIVQLDAAETNWTPEGNAGAMQPIDVTAMPVSGYFKLENFENISYVVRD